MSEFGEGQGRAGMRRPQSRKMGNLEGGRSAWVIVCLCLGFMLGKLARKGFLWLFCA